jgi:hypothetical protein
LASIESLELSYILLNFPICYTISYHDDLMLWQNSMPSFIPVAHPPGLAAHEDLDMVDSLFGPIAAA